MHALMHSRIQTRPKSAEMKSRGRARTMRTMYGAFGRRTREAIAAFEPERCAQLKV